MAQVISFENEQKLDKIKAIRERSKLRQQALPKKSKSMPIHQQLKHFRETRPQRPIMDMMKPSNPDDLTMEEINGLKEFVKDKSIKLLAIPMEPEGRPVFEQNLKQNKVVNKYIEDNVVNTALGFTSIFNQHSRFLFNYSLEFSRSKPKTELEIMLEKRMKEQADLKRQEEIKAKIREASHVSECGDNSVGDPITDDENPNEVL